MPNDPLDPAVVRAAAAVDPTVAHTVAHAPDPAHPRQIVATCASCGRGITSEVRDTTARLLRTLDPARRDVLAQQYGDTAVPAQQCADCFNATASVLNAAAFGAWVEA